MLTLYQLEDCPACTRVRKFLRSKSLTYTIVNVPRLGSERKEVLALKGVTSAEVPVLTDGDQVLQGSDEIIRHITEHGKESYGDPAYGFTRTLPGMSYGDAIPAVKEALANEGFGVLTEIDVKATLKKKINVDFRPYIILGACNPNLAHQALSFEAGLGLLLPCNVVVTTNDDGEAVVSAVDPKKMFEVVNNDGLLPVAEQVRKKLRAVLSSIKTQS